MKVQFGTDSQALSFARAYLVFERTALDGLPLNESESDYVLKQLKDENDLVIVNRYNELLLIGFADHAKEKFQFAEHCRRRGNDISAVLRKERITEISVIVPDAHPGAAIDLAEGMALGSYQFIKYRSDTGKKPWQLEKISFSGNGLPDELIRQLSSMVDAVFIARDLVNEPSSHLNAVSLSESFEEMGKIAGFSTQVLHKDEIMALNMGGLLAVNMGSIDPPTFSVMKWEPEDAKNTDPIVLVGKGVVFDSGGLSLKPTKDSMDYMKCDMAGGAVVAAVMYFAAQCRLPLKLVGLVPATDNRPDGNAFAPGDIIRMHGGQSVEVLNTDAEGRLLLADALSYAKSFRPELVIDVATLTGAAAMAIGSQGIAGMGTAGDQTFGKLKKAGENVYERVVEFPLWEEYAELIKSEIADMKNIGGREAGAISAGKFLEKFTDYPWIHLDIAGPAFLNKADHYRTTGGTASGARLLMAFLKDFM